MESDDDMALLVVKEQLIHFRTKKVNEEECKNPLALWKTQSIFFLCWVCSLIKFGDCGISN
jgi:hypothetical protein